MVSPQFASNSNAEDITDVPGPVGGRVEYNRKSLQPQSRDGRKLSNDVDDHPWMPTSEHSHAKGSLRQTLGERLSKAHVAR